jgi:hypothetical protein
MADAIDEFTKEDAELANDLLDKPKITLWYSSDGKNTIQIEGLNENNLSHYDELAKTWYRITLEEFGKKGSTPDMKRDYGGNLFAASLDGEVCPIHNQPMIKSKKGSWYHKDGNQICMGKGYFTPNG